MAKTAAPARVDTPALSSRWVMWVWTVEAGDEQLGRDLPLGAAPDQQPQDLDLAAGEAGREADPPGRVVAGGLQDRRDRLVVQARLGHKGPGRLGWWVGWAVGRSETRAW